MAERPHRSAAPERGADFADLVHRLLTTSPTHEMEDVARGMGLTYAAFYNRVRNRTVFSADEIRRLLCVFPDPQLAQFLLEGTPYLAADRLPAPEDTAFEDTIQRGAERIVIEAAGILEAAYTAMEDSHIDHREAAAIRREVQVAERALATLRAHLDKLAQR